jgi:hypothetical protein
LFAGSADGSISTIDLNKAMICEPIRPLGNKWSILALSTNSLGTLLVSSAGSVVFTLILGHQTI